MAVVITIVPGGIKYRGSPEDRLGNGVHTSNWGPGTLNGLIGGLNNPSGFPKAEYGWKSSFWPKGHQRGKL